MASVPWWCCCGLAGDCPCTQYLCLSFQTCKLRAYWDITLSAVPASCDSCAESLWCPPAVGSCGGPITINGGSPWSFTHTYTDLKQITPGDCSARGEHASVTTTLDQWVYPCPGLKPPCEYEECSMLSQFPYTIFTVLIVVQPPQPSTSYKWRATCNAFSFGQVIYETGVRTNCSLPASTDWIEVSNTLVNLGCVIDGTVYSVSSKTATLGSSFPFDLQFIP